MHRDDKIRGDMDGEVKVARYDERDARTGMSIDSKYHVIRNSHAPWHR